MDKREEIHLTASKALEGIKQGGLGLSMGIGKTYIALKHMNKHYTDSLSVLVVAPKVIIYKTWKEEAEKWNLKHLINHITFTTYLSLNKHNPDDYDIIYLDECHSLKYSHDDWLKNFQGIIIGLTGTPPRYDFSEKGKMVNRYCPIVYQYLAQSAMSDNILNKINIQVCLLELSSVKNIKQTIKNGGFFHTSELKSYEYWSDKLDTAVSAKQQMIFRIMRMKAMQEFPSKEEYAKKLLNATGEKCILFCNTQDQADRLCSHSYHSNNLLSDENLIKFGSGEIDKMSCVLQISEGITIPRLQSGIIMHSYGNERKASQRMGRLLRLNPDELATIYILCYKDTIDEMWVKQSLEDYDQSRIKWTNISEILIS